ncbi:surface lipoprotein assembly modifier [Yoonia sp.]|jgi:hypothetical protein|uniref:surface lipoprotein assembly modifier n=1 Tax=Yoonia sp. TaxID=2212373 RepID=UPI0025F0CCBD|nr:surface lipoprotein assembly modifier [Yoonia sp.]
MNKHVLALVACLLGSAASAQTTVDVSIEDARVIATRALFAGDTALALQIALRLLEADPNDRAALLVVAAAAPRLGDPKTGRRAGARAWAVSQTDVQKYEAARLTALAAANEERYTLATFWLRRALTVAPNPDEEAKTLRDAAGVRRINPWSTRLGLSVVPSNNINGGATDETLTAPGLPDGTLSPDALALGGVRATLSFRTQYRLRATEKSRTTVALQYQASRVRLNDNVDVDVADSEFSTDATEMTLGYDRALETGSLGASVTVGTFDFGGEDYFDFKRLALSRNVALSDTTGLQLSVQREQQTYVSTGIGTVDRYVLRTSVSRKLASGNRVGTALTYTVSEGDSVNYTFDDWSIQGSYNWAEPFGPISLGISGGIKWTDYPDYRLIAFVDGGREDVSVFYNLNIGFPDVSYAGFSPGLAISGSIAESNVSRFTRDTLSVALTVNSTF